MGYTTTAQLNSTLEGNSVLSTKAILAMVENLKVNPTFLLLGRGNMFLTEKDEVEQLNTQLKDCLSKHQEAIDTIKELNEKIIMLEKRNDDLVDITSAAIKYHKGGKEEPKNKD